MLPPAGDAGTHEYTVSAHQLVGHPNNLETAEQFRIWTVPPSGLVGEGDGSFSDLTERLAPQRLVDNLPVLQVRACRRSGFYMNSQTLLQTPSTLNPKPKPWTRCIPTQLDAAKASQIRKP